MANLRKSFDGMMRRYGHNILLQRRENAYTADTATYKNQLERHTVRSMVPSRRLPNVAMEMPEGITHDSEAVYYFRWDANPREGDRIYENIEIYPNGIETFLIDKAIPMRARGGRIEYWACGASQETPN